MSDTRRRFLQQAGGCLALAVASVLGASAADAAALPVVTITGEQDANQRRYPIPSADSVSIDRETQVVLVRYQNQVCALALACPHQQAAVRWVEGAKQFQCTRHDSHYGPEGVHLSGRATRNMDRFPIRRDAASVLVTIDGVFRSDVDPAGWAAAFVSV